MMKVPAKRIQEFILVLILVLNCHSVYDVGNMDLHLNVIAIIIIITLLFESKIVIRMKTLHLIGIYCLFQVPIIWYSFTISDYVYTYIIKYVFFVIFLTLLYSMNDAFARNMIYYFIKIMYVLAVLSLFFYIFATILHLIKPTGAFYINWSPARWVRNYYGIYFEVNGSHLFDYKNSSIFAESPINAALLGMALDFELFYDCKTEIEKKHVIVFVMALLSTFSTLAYIVLAMSFFGFIFVNYKAIVHSKMGRLIAYISIVVIGVIALHLALYAYNYKKYAIGESFLVRSDDYSVAFQALKSNPIFGVGFGNTSYTSLYMSAQRLATGNMGQSSDFASLIASGGLYFFSIYIIGGFGLLKGINSVPKKIMFISILEIIFIVSRVGATLLFISFIVMGLHYFFAGNKDEE